MSVTRLLLAPGASGGVERLAPYARAMAAHGVEVTTVALPRGAAERAVPAYAAALRGHAPAEVAIGGHSFGGRVASLLVADLEPDVRPAALVLLSYPLHAPGRQDAWDARTVHWPRVTCPVLLLSGEADPFARMDLLRTAVGRLPDARLRTWPGVGHGLKGPALAEAAAEVATFIAQRT